MSGEIVLGGSGVDAAAFGTQDVTVVDVVPTESSRFKNKRRVNGVETEENSWQIAITFQGDDGKRSTGYYGGISPNEDGTFYFGPNGHARRFIAMWQEATGRTVASLNDLLGSRFKVGLADFFGPNGVKKKLAPIGKAASDAVPVGVSPAGAYRVRRATAATVAAGNPFAALAAPAPVFTVPAAPPAWTPAQAFNELDAATRASLTNVSKSGTPEPQIIAALRGLKPSLTEEQARAVIQHAKAQ